MKINKIKLGLAFRYYDNPVTGGELHNARLCKALVNFDIEPYNAWINKLPFGLDLFPRLLGDPVIILKLLFSKINVLVLDNGVHSPKLARLFKRFKPDIPIVGLFHYLHSERPPEVENISFSLFLVML